MATRADVQQRLGRAVKAVRAQQGLTQEQVSAAAGLHPTYVSDIERGARNPSWEALTRLASGIGVPITEIARAYEAQSPSGPSDATASAPASGKRPQA